MTWGKTNLTNCNIVNNIATSNGGGIYNGRHLLCKSILLCGEIH